MSFNSNKQAPRIARAAARYRPGKAPVQSQVGDSYSSDEEIDEEEKLRDESNARNSNVEASSSLNRKQAGIIIQTGNGSIKSDKVAIHFQSKPDQIQREEEEDSSEYETDTEEDVPEPIKPTFRKPGTSQTATHTQAAKGTSSEYETDSEEEESSSEDDRPQLIKPIFKSKSQREGNKETTKTSDSGTNLIQTKALEEAENRRTQSHLLVAERIRQELQEKNLEDNLPDISDTDGKDPEAEFTAWRIRELSRIKREREASRLKEEERAEIERRRMMPEEERLKEDMERAKSSRSEKEKRRKEGEQQGFMQKYYHKGSFYQDMDILNKREYSSMTESAVNKKSLPEVMQVRDYGKKGRSKWTHLVNEDTSSDRRQNRGRDH